MRTQSEFISCILRFTHEKKARLNFLRNTQPTNQKSEQLWKYIVRPIRDKNDSTLQWRATSTRLSVKKKWMKKCQDLLSMKEQKDDFIDEQETERTPE